MVRSDYSILYKKFRPISTIKKVIIIGPANDLIADLLEALIIVNSDVRERPRYIHNEERRIIKGRILYIISGKFNNDNLKSMIKDILLISYFLIYSVISNKTEIQHITISTVKNETKNRLIKYISSFKLDSYHHFSF